jgi:phytoene synthase
MALTKPQNLRAYSYESIAKGSLSFAFAARLLPLGIRDRVVKLYAWCRYVDNEVDLRISRLDPESRRRELDALQDQSFGSFSMRTLPVAMEALRSLRTEVPFPEDYARDLIRGMEMDLDGVHYEEFEQLHLYCYRVAGVVGLMMTRVMGVDDPAALKHAEDLGVGMQLTNISRDIAEDAAMGRVYLPASWLREAGIELPSELMDPTHRDRLVTVVGRVLAMADRYYRSGDAGLKFLPLRCAIGIAAAREIYAAIGHEVMARGARAWDQRVWIPWYQKLWYAGKGLLKVMKTLPYRWRRELHTNTPKTERM